ncbi:MAG TPA: hypothetical protein VG890_09865 [Puia sp.]|nr:hypothetical protein [Puia sp.]
MATPISINKYLPFAILYFFLNSVFLPLGLLYTTLLTPVFLYWLYRENRLEYGWVFFALTIPLAVIHYVQGIDAAYYLKSWLLLFSVFVFILTVRRFLQVTQSLQMIFRVLLTLNFYLVLIACVIFFFPGIRRLMWSVYDISSGLTKFPRLSLFTYEPSYYSTLLVPLAFYYYLKLIFFRYPNRGLVLFMVTLPLLISFSLGVLLGITISFLLLFASNIRSFLMKRRVAEYVMLSLFVVVLVLIALFLFYPGNPLFLRIRNIFHGTDTSFKGRAFDSFSLALAVARVKNIFFGVGLGQLKVVGGEIWNTYYNTVFNVNQIAIPNAVAETFALFGIAGLLIRFSLEAYFFFRTKPYTNYYRFGLFIYIFIYQFTGSYLFNIAEYVIWALAFSRVFEEFDKSNLRKNPAQ